MNWTPTAKRRWPKANWISGRGPHACLAHCGELTIELCNSPAEAADAKAMIDATGCGHRCCGRHEIIDLRAHP